mmetsp:Transcript_23562/g.56205  ORF Transcript_23562/g.56205 Transcript_23562/m.56205 type:complete len:246 (+) Transcript_23562:872-1609(+)
MRRFPPEVCDAGSEKVHDHDSAVGGLGAAVQHLSAEVQDVWKALVVFQRVEHVELPLQRAFHLHTPALLHPLDFDRNPLPAPEVFPDQNHPLAALGNAFRRVFRRLVLLDHVGEHFSLRFQTHNLLAQRLRLPILLERDFAIRVGVDAVKKRARRAEHLLPLLVREILRTRGVCLVELLLHRRALHAFLQCLELLHSYPGLTRSFEHWLGEDSRKFVLEPLTLLCNVLHFFLQLSQIGFHQRPAR